MSATASTAAELQRFVELGLVAARPAPDDESRLQLSTESLWLLDVFGQMRALGFTEALGYRPDDILVYDEAMHRHVRARDRCSCRAHGGAAAGRGRRRWSSAACR